MALSKITTNSIADDAVTTAKVNPAQTDITSLGTLSSATVSGDLTVDTNTLKVDSSNNRVGIGLTDPSDLFEVSNSADTPTRAIITAEDSSGSNQNAFIKTKAKGNYYEGLEMASTSGHIGMWGGYYSGGAILQARVGGSGINSSDVLAMQIDANGIITMPSQPAFMASSNSNNNHVFSSADSYEQIITNVETIDKNSDYANSTFTAPVDGTYFISGAIMHNASSSGVVAYDLAVYVNSSLTLYARDGHDNYTITRMHAVNGLVDLDANDTVKLYARVADTKSQIYFSLTTLKFQGYLVA